MQYFSYIDNFNLKLEHLIHLSHSDINNIIESLNLKPTQELPQTITDLMNSSIREFHYCIESTPWLKAILTDDFKSIKQYDISLDTSVIKNSDDFKTYLEPYLYAKVSELINYMLNTESYSILFKILEHNILFSNKVKTRIINSLKAKLNYAIDFLEDDLLGKTDANINYVKSYHFFNVLNLYKNEFNREIPKLYHCLLQVHEQFNTTTNDNYKFTSQALVAFGNSELDDIGTKLLIDDNADHAKQYAFKINDETVKETNSNILKALGTLIVLILLLITVIVSQRNITYVDNSDDTKPIEITPKKKRYNYDNRIRFYYSLKRKVTIGKKHIESQTQNPLPFKNPYPKTFNLVDNDTLNIINAKRVLIENNSKKDLIVFRLKQGKDESVYIPKNNHTYINLKTKDSVLFYWGQEFAITKFSHFKYDSAISEIYKVNYKEDDKNKIIIVNDIFKPTKKEKVSISDDDITSKNIVLTKISINNLYSNYYNNYSN